MAANPEDIPVEYRKKDGDNTDKMIEFLCTIGRLKQIERAGWILPGRDVPKPETVSGHMYRMAIMSMLFEEEEKTKAIENNVDHSKLDIGKLVQMSLVHDMAECIVGDITPFDGIPEQEKHRRELNAMNHLASCSEKMMQMYTEYEKRETIESKIVKELDRFDVMLQAFQYERTEYERASRVVRFDEFFTIAFQHVHHAKLRPLVIRIIEERDKFFSQITPQA